MLAFTKTLLALTLAITLVTPSVYLGMLPVQEARAQSALDLPAPGVADLAAAGGGITVCYLGGWLASAFAGLAGMVGLGAIVTAPAAGVAAPASATAVAAGPTSVTTAGTAVGTVTAEAATAAATAVPISDPANATANAALLAISGAISLQLSALNASNQVTASTLQSISVSESTNVFKECVLDPLLWMFKEMVIDAVTDSIIAWVEGGFEGQPQFLEDPGEFFKSIAGEAVSAFLFESGLDTILCEPFKVDIVLDIAWDYYMPDNDPSFGRLSCSFDDMFPGVDASISIDSNGDGRIDASDTPATGVGATAAYTEMTTTGNIDFPGGGFGAVLAMLDDSNNEIGSRFQVQEAAAKFAQKEVAEKEMAVDQGDGWLPTYCDIDNNPDTAPTICTPGEMIAEQVNEWTGGQLKQLTVADEFAEILNAVIKLLIEQILSAGNNFLQRS